MLSPIQDDVKLIQDECKAILGLDKLYLSIEHRRFNAGSASVCGRY
ncbi:hypothetical protein [Desertivirga arenae]|nr:hypothetical protein [Pedobacter sp. SYSU D00823]